MGNIFKPETKKTGLSGVVSYSILLNPENNKFTILLGDIHDGVTYCNTNKFDNIYIHDFLDKLSKSKNISVLLEEVPRNDKIKLTELWPNAFHTQELKNLFLNNQDRIIPVDPRPYLVPFSFQKYENNLLSDIEKNMKMEQYLETFDSLFFLNKKIMDRNIIFFENIVNALNSKTPQKGIISMYKLLKSKYLLLKNDIKVDDSFEESYKRNKYFFYMLDELKMNIMDWYTVLLLLGKKHNVIHFGLAHYLNVRNILENQFKFKVLYKKGLETLNNKFPVNACMEI